jgi:WD40 repeat protein
VIEKAPLQLYCSALVFAPEKSIVRRQFERCIPDWIQIKPKVQAHWDAARQVLEGHSLSVTSVAFSADSKLAASGSRDGTVRLWDALTGEARQTLKGDSSGVTSVAHTSHTDVHVSTLAPSMTPPNSALNSSRRSFPNTPKMVRQVRALLPSSMDVNRHVRDLKVEL